MREVWLLRSSFIFVSLLLIQAFKINLKIRWRFSGTSGLAQESESRVVTRQHRYYAIRDNRIKQAENVQATDEIIEPAVYVDDLYGALGVAPNASKQELKEAYWALSFRNHPDRNNVQ
jgi:DnaJ-domain-containing protein 1